MARTAAFCVALLLATAAHAGALDKYSMPESAPPPPYGRFDSPELERGTAPLEEALRRKQLEAVKKLLAMPEREQRQWIERFRERIEKARAAGRGDEALYYQGIIELWESLR